MPEDTKPTTDTESGPQPPVVTDPPAEPTPASTPAEPAVKKSGKKFGLAAIIVIAVVVLLGGSAGAYFGVIVPNKPENVLKTATQKLLEKRQIASKGSLNVDMNGKDAKIKNFKVNFTSSSDADKKAFQAALEGEVSGAKLPIELRSVDKSLYFKVGDLKSVKGLASTESPEAAEVIDAIGSKVSNQWIEIDESLLKQTNTDCATDGFNGLTKQDIDQIMTLYSKNEFVTIKSKASDKVDGRSATRYDLGLDKTKAEAFGKQLNTVDTFKKLKECADKTSGNKDSSSDKEVKDAVDDTTFSMSVWVDGSKNIRQVQVKAVDKENAATLTVTLTDDKVNITKPEGAKPLMEVLGDFGGLLGGASSASGSEVDGVSEQCMAAIEAYAASSGTSAIPAECM